ncbi:Non-homologous end-joining factor 1 [Colletotrichum chlorophyti]|uniref:Non-homologous end-joining factor 1 n=1 Tax=Colletotrichum chlorophyti TaxID=708187 RepID=A0A1Q8RMM9_9PEZI|nr:Non-homologous end-joining factor 1 [Colletotrichum chlorophyti]
MPVWRPLPVQPSTGLPYLLVSTTFSKDAYTIYITDLANIWAESMDRRAIFKRSLNESTSIDPTDSDNNMRAFLSKINSVFDPSHEDHDKASMTLSTTPRKEAGEGGLSLDITCELDNMQPLEWPMYLQRRPQSELTTELVVPLAQATSSGRRQVDSLLGIINQKDIVIMKLLDKLEATGTRLENIFTTLSAKQKPTRKMAEDKVKGLAPFRHDEWKSQLDGAAADLPGVIEHVFGAAGLGYRHDIGLVGMASLDNWWTQSEFSSIPILEPGSRSRTSQPAAHSLAQEWPAPGRLAGDYDETGVNDDDDDFQVQSTPPRLMAARKPSTTAVTQDDESTEDDDEDISQVPDSVPLPPPELKSHPVRLGTVGQKRQRTPTHISPPLRASEPEGSETETESEEAPSPQPTEPQLARNVVKGGLGRIGSEAHRSKTPESPKRAGLGRIGGRAKHSKSPEPSRKGGLGRIGGGSARSSRSPEPPVTATEERGRRRIETEAQDKPRETSQERADRKRDELQKELQRKAASGPTRKKRKF